MIPDRVNRKRFSGETSVPADACIFIRPDAVQLADGDEPSGFEIEAYDGGIIPNHWYWGNLAFDLSGLAFENKKRTPVFDSHDYNVRLGFSTKQSVRPTVHMAGEFLENADAQSLRSDMKKGFPMQASMGVLPRIVEQVSEGASVEVNGHTLKGPGAVFRKALIREVSMCPFGAVPNTSSTAFADPNSQQIEFELLGKDTPMAPESKPALTMEILKAEYPEIFQMSFQAGQGAGAAEQLDRFKALQKACGDDTALLAECFAAGLTVAETLAKRNEKLAAELKAANEKLAAKPKPRSAVDAATAEFIEQPAPKDKAAEFDEAKATDMELEAHFAATPALRDQFSSAKAYVAHVRHPPKN
jgi:hypothetical protein